MRSIYETFIKAAYIFRDRADILSAERAKYTECQFKYLSMALLSQVWLKWCCFCRDVIITSCNGVTTRSHTFIRPRMGDNSWQRIAYEIKNRNRGISPGRTIRFRSQEPTWGDVTVLVDALPILSPANAHNLVTGFGLSLNGPKHIQCVRNSCYHTNVEAVDEVKSILHHYTGTVFKHPIDLIWWYDTTGVNAIYSWLDDLEDISDIVTK